MNHSNWPALSDLLLTRYVVAQIQETCLSQVGANVPNIVCNEPRGFRATPILETDTLGIWTFTQLLVKCLSSSLPSIAAHTGLHHD